MENTFDRFYYEHFNAPPACTTINKQSRPNYGKTKLTLLGVVVNFGAFSCLDIYGADVVFAN
jgi:hypothetical protein